MLRRIAGLVIVVAFLVSSLFLCVNTMHVNRVYSVTGSYSTLPADDAQLKQWLEVQPGVLARTVQLRRDGAAIRVRFVMSQTVRGNPPVPDFSASCDSLGYRPLRVWNDDQTEWGEKSE
jgi:hypothetical protein